MELEGFKRMMGSLREADLNVNKLVTDRNRSLAKYVRENKPTILHMYDVWHIAKCNRSYGFNVIFDHV